MNFGTRLRTILAVATCLNTALMATDVTGFNNDILDAVYKIASIVLNFIIVAISTYYNNDYTETAHDATIMMRLAKASEDVEQTDDDEDIEEEIGEVEDGSEDN